MKLTLNEKKLMKHLIEDGRASDIDIAKKMGVSSQAVGKMRKKLEVAGLIRGYRAVVNFAKVGIGVFSIAKIELLPSLFKEVGREVFVEGLQKTPYITRVIRTTEHNLILFAAFRDQKELDVYASEVWARYGVHMGSKYSLILPNSSVLKRSDKSVALNAINKC